MTISRTGLLCLAIVWFSSLAGAQAQPDPAAQQQPPAQPPPAAQQPVPSPPPQQLPAQPAPAPQQPPAETPQVESPRLKLPPAPPKVIDVRMPGEAGYYVGLTGWQPIGSEWVDKGHAASFTALTKLQLAGKAKGAPGGEIGIAAGLHNSVRLSYFQSKLSGPTTAPTDLVIFSQPYTKGDQLSTNSKLQVGKVSYEYLTWPYPVEKRHFRLKTLWQAQYINVKTVFDAPVLSGTGDSAGNFTSFATLGSKGYITPSFGLGVHEYATGNIHFEVNASGFAWPHRFQVWDVDATVAYRVGHIELRGGGKAFHFRTSPRQDYFYRGTTGGVLVGLRWYSD